MNRSIAGIVAVICLIGLTMLTWQLAEHEGSAWSLAGVAMLKVVVILVVFLELYRSWPGWLLTAVALMGAVLGLSAWWTLGAGPL